MQPPHDYSEDSRSANIIPIVIIGAALFAALIVMALWPRKAHGAQIDMLAIQQIESGGRAWVIAKDGSVGLYQLMPCVLAEYNRFHGTWWTMKDLLDPRLNYVIAAWYLTCRIPAMLTAYGKPVTTRNVIIAYNAGIRAVVCGYVPKTTRAYLAKYARLTGRQP